MNLINPGFLFALAAAAVPVLIHLLSRRRVPELPFSSLRFLRRSDRRSMRRVSLRRLLLLALRTVAIALVVLAFARPVVEGRLAALIPAGTPRTVRQRKPVRGAQRLQPGRAGAEGVPDLPEVPLELHDPSERRAQPGGRDQSELHLHARNRAGRYEPLLQHDDHERTLGELEDRLVC